MSPCRVRCRVLRVVRLHGAWRILAAVWLWCASPSRLLQVRTLDLQYPYFYLRNARDNHAPNSMWGYSQLLFSGWPYQADSNEIVAQVRP